jgi:hypothetical protein
MFYKIKKANGADGVNGLHAQLQLGGMEVKPELAFATTQHSLSMESHVLDRNWKNNLVALVNNSIS